MISDAAQSSRLDRQEAEHKELLGKVEGLEAADVYLQVSFFYYLHTPMKACRKKRFFFLDITTVFAKQFLVRQTNLGMC